MVQRNDIDVMVTHVNPSIEIRHQARPDDANTGFYCFDGKELLDQSSARYWIFGHIHEPKTYVHKRHGRKGIVCLCNPLGHPEKAGKVQIQQITVPVKRKNSIGRTSWSQNFNQLMATSLTSSP